MSEEAPQLSQPNADFTVSVQSGEAPLSVDFTNASSGTIAGYAWSFGDGHTSGDENPQHTFEEPGNFIVSLTVFNSAGSSTHTFRIDVDAPDVAEESSREETVLDLIRSIRSALRRPSEQKLRYRDILDVLNDLLRGYARDLQVTEQNHRTDEKTGSVSYTDGSNYLLKVDGVKDVEVMALSFVPNEELAADPQTIVWREVTLVPLDYYASKAQLAAAVGALFGGMLVDDGVKLKLNLAKETVERSQWRVRYRVPLLKLLTIASRTPLPADMLPMIKTEAVIGCLPRMRDDSKEFYEWRKANEKIWISQVSDWRRRWEEFLTTNTEPNVAPKTAFNDFRRRRRAGVRYTIERRD